MFDGGGEADGVNGDGGMVGHGSLGVHSHVHMAGSLVPVVAAHGLARRNLGFKSLWN